MHKFRIKKAAHDHFRIQFVYNAEIMVWSENYVAKSSAVNCINSIKKNAPDAVTVDLSLEETGKGYRFEIVKNAKGEFFVRFRASNGEIMVISEGYVAKASAKNCIESIKKNAPEAPVEDETLVA